MQQSILIVGNCGSGKTTLARYLAQHLHLRHIELDAVSHLPGWQSRSPRAFQAEVIKATEKPGWVICGNYESQLRDLLWHQATTVVWLDDNFARTLLRLTLRTLRRLTTGEELWNGNRETWRRTFSRDSIFWWLFKTYRRRRVSLIPRMTEGDYSHLRRFHIRNNRQYRFFLHSLQAPIVDWGFRKLQDNAEQVSPTSASGRYRPLI